MNDQSQMMMNLNKMNQSQMMNPQMMNPPPQVINNQSQQQQQQPQLLSHQPQMKMMSQNQQQLPPPPPPMMTQNRGGGGYNNKVWSQQQLPLDPNMKFQNPNIKHNFPNLKPGRSNNNNNWKGKKVSDKRKDIRRMDKPNQTISMGIPNNIVGYQPPTLHELQSQNRLKARKFYPKKKFNARFAPYAPRNTTSFIIRAKKSGGIASLVSPCPVTPAVLPTPILSPSREILGDMAKEEWGVDGYGSMKGLIRLRDVHDDEDEEDGGSGSSESDVEEHVEVERRLDQDLSRFEMIYPNYGGGDYNNVLENRVDDQDSHIAQLEEENLTLRERLFLMERELGDLRRRMLFLERQNQAVVEDVNEEVVENGSDNESEGGSDVPVMGIENNVDMVDSMLESGRNENIEANVAVKLDNDGVSEAEGVDDVFMEESVPSEVVSNQDGIKSNELGGGFMFDDVKEEKDKQKNELATQQCLTDEGFAKENELVNRKESGENEMIDRNDELKTHEEANESIDGLVSETDECKNQIVGKSSETARDDDLSVAQ
ncbi:uncharacterized protein [Medicago truncatula]|uniref:PRLI-interacting factor A n=1 Tax=Medicago truncatula TaxID=3880 RepID=G7IAX9_MEDTR|nr:uncharacterized protein LOC11418639 [Medicago truncatula]AES63065.1 PRLI-interacting factor A [Medicago truncatula]